MKRFGMTQDGRETRIFRLENEHFSAEVTDYGASLVSFRDKETGIDIVQGYDDVRGYELFCPYMGATVGRVCNRIRDGRFTLDGQTYQLDRNDRGNCLHGGRTSTAFRVWDAEETADGIVFTCFSPDGEGGFPGNVTMKAEYRLSDEGLRIDMYAETDRDTYVALTNHAFFNLDGPLSESVLGHELMICSDEVSCIDENGQTGDETLAVAGTPFDFRTFRRIGERIDDDHEQLKYAGGYDHSFLIRGEGLRLCASVRTAAEQLDVWSDLPALQIYTGNGMNGSGKGKEGGTFPYRSAVCLEAQYVPDAVNSRRYAKPLVKAGETQHSTILFCVHRI